MTLITPNTGLICLFSKTKKYIYIFHLGFAKHDMSSKIVGWMELKIKSGIDKNPEINKVSLDHIFSWIFQEFTGFSKIQELVLFIVMANTEFLPRIFI